MDKERKSEIHITNNFNAPIGQHIDHVDTINFRMDGDGTFHFGMVEDVKNEAKGMSAEPTREEMIHAVKTTYQQGMWWSNRSWAVVYRVYQIKGYVKGFTDFVREVQGWDVKIGFECNYDAIQKPLAAGQLMGDPDSWERQGAQKQATALAKALLEILEKR